MTTFICITCNSSFASKFNLNRHTDQGTCKMSNRNKNITTISGSITLSRPSSVSRSVSDSLEFKAKLLQETAKLLVDFGVPTEEAYQKLSELPVLNESFAELRTYFIKLSESMSDDAKIDRELLDEKFKKVSLDKRKRGIISYLPNVEGEKNFHTIVEQEILFAEYYVDWLKFYKKYSANSKVSAFSLVSNYFNSEYTNRHVKIVDVSSDKKRRTTPLPFDTNDPVDPPNFLNPALVVNERLLSSSSDAQDAQADNHVQPNISDNMSECSDVIVPQNRPSISRNNSNASSVSRDNAYENVVSTANTENVASGTPPRSSMFNPMNLINTFTGNAHK